MDTTQVLIAGAGPVGMTIAASLARFNIKCIIAEKNFMTTSHPKMDITNSRSMEIFKSLGLSDKLRAVAVPEDHCFDVSWITNFNGHELARFKYPSPLEFRGISKKINDGSRPSEPPMRVSQVEIEPVLKTHLENSHLVDVRFGFEFIDFEQNENEVVSTLLNKETNEIIKIKSDYLVGSDGGGSKVRSNLGINLSGDAKIMQRYMVHFRSPRKDLLMRWGRAWHYQSVYGTLISQNDNDIWTLHTRLPKDVKLEDIKPSDLITQFVGEPIEHEVLVSNPWSPHLLVADSYGQKRVWLAGDAAHQYIPTGGYGMNTGVGDAFDLSWKIAARIIGFSGENLISSYEDERRPIGLRNCQASRNHNKIRVENAMSYNEELFLQSKLGEISREKASKEITDRGNEENESLGIELGYVYDKSPVIIHEDFSQLVFDPINYKVTTIPGARLPNVILDDGSNLLDKLDKWFNLIVIGDVDHECFINYASENKIPLKVINLDENKYEKIYKANLILVRPDHHISWRNYGANKGLSPKTIFDHVLGFC